MQRLSPELPRVHRRFNSIPQVYADGTLLRIMEVVMFDLDDVGIAAHQCWTALCDTQYEYRRAWPRADGSQASTWIEG
jgi:hypothetical protein